MSCEHKFEKSYVCDSGTYVGFECVKCNMIVSCNVENPYEVVEWNDSLNQKSNPWGSGIMQQTYICDIGRE